MADGDRERSSPSVKGREPCWRAEERRSLALESSRSRDEICSELSDITVDSLRAWGGKGGGGRENATESHNLYLYVSTA